MPRSFTLNIKDHRTGTASHASVEIPDEEWAALTGFCESAAALADTDYVRVGIPDLCEVNSDDLLVARTPLPAPRIVREFLHVLRPLILSSEPYCYERITRILGRRLDHPLWRDLIKGYVKSFRADASQHSFTARAGDLILNSECALNLWLNSYEYHRDADKRAELDRAKDFVSWELSQALFLDILGAKAEAILELAEIIKFLSDGLAKADTIGEGLSDTSLEPTAEEHSGSATRP